MSPLSPTSWGAGASGGGVGSIAFEQVLGAPAATLDTGPGGIPGGGRLLLFYLYWRTDEAVATSQINLTFNADTGANYDQVRLTGQNVTASAANALAGTSVPLTGPGATAAANTFGMVDGVVFRYANVVGFKPGRTWNAIPVPVAANMEHTGRGFGYRSAAAISRLTLTPNTGGVNLVTGSSLLCVVV